VIPWTEVSAGWHDDYVRGRPGYPSEVVRIPGLASTAVVLELGAGTGKLTSLLVDAFVRVLAIEPDPEMRHRFAAATRQARLIAGTAEQIPLAETSVDGVFVAEAFHWFAHERALDEIARVLRPRGALVLIWNRPAGPVEPAITAVEELLRPHWPENVEMPLDLNTSRMPYARDWAASFARSAFEPLQEARFANPHQVDRDGLVSFFASMGWISALPDKQREALIDGIRARLTASHYRLPFDTHASWTRLAAPDEPR
jgi:ubiquinone/menaquinone biosynthesis C-methylase UbiE